MTSEETIVGLLNEALNLEKKGDHIMELMDNAIEEGNESVAEAIYAPALLAISEDIFRVTNLIDYHREVLDARHDFVLDVLTAARNNNWKMR